MVATRATLARTAIIFAARSEPKAIVLVGTETLLETLLKKRDRGYRIVRFSSKERSLVLDLGSYAF
jgi:hypothetical protein